MSTQTQTRINASDFAPLSHTATEWSGLRDAITSYLATRKLRQRDAQLTADERDLAGWTAKGLIVALSLFDSCEVGEWTHFAALLEQEIALADYIPAKVGGVRLAQKLLRQG